MTEPTDLDQLDDDRVMGALIEMAPRRRHQPLIYRYLVCGARFFARRNNDDTLSVVLGFTDDHKTVAAMRAEVWGTEPDEPTETERGEALLLAKDIPVSAVMPKPQG
jgi:hypothetical protein